MHWRFEKRTKDFSKLNRKFYDEEKPHALLGMLMPKEFVERNSSSTPSPMERKRDVYDRYNPIDIYNSKCSDLINLINNFILT